MPHHLVEAIHKKQAYLNVPFFLVRAFVYLGVWALFAELLRRWSLRQDDDPAGAPRSRAVALSSGGLWAFGFTLTFAAFDWLMSLSPGWLSKIFGAYVFAGAMVGGLGAMVVLLWALRRHGLLDEAARRSHLHALGRLLLTFTVFWMYMAYSQGFLIWIADMPHEVEWYLARWDDGWLVIVWTLGLGHFLVPFFLLLSRRLKRSFRATAAVGGWMLLMHAVDIFWLVLPSLHERGEPAHRVLRLWLANAWMDAGALLFVGGAAVAFAAWRQAGHSLVPLADPRLPASLEYESP